MKQISTDDYEYYRPTRSGIQRVGFTKQTIEKRKQHRRMKNKMAKQSRKRNR